MEQKDILIVDDDENMNFALSETLKRKNFTVDSAFSYLEAKEKINFFNYPMIITDVRMPDGNGIKLVSEIKKKNMNTKVIVITAYGKVEDAVIAMKAGAEDYILKPFASEKIIKLVEKYYPNYFNRFSNNIFLTRNQKQQEMLEKIVKAAKTDAPILVRGESGTGKEVIAKLIHNSSNRKEKSYIAVNCAAIPENLLESELFGYEKGAFTGADKFKPGKFELADKGTLVLDEIGDMPLSLQAKILRVLQEKEVDRLGSNKIIPVDIRVVSLTNKRLEELIAKNEFREDLYYRLNVVEIEILPLRERKEDIIYLSEHFVKLYTKEIGKNELKLSKKSQDKLLSHVWYGNVRELQNVIQRAVIFAEGNEIKPEDIEFKDIKKVESNSNKEIMTVYEMEKDLILRALEKTGGNKTKAAELLGISSRTLRNKLNEYKINSNE